MEDSQNPVPHSDERNDQSLWLTIFSSVHLIKDTLIGLKNEHEHLWNEEIHPNSVSASAELENDARDIQIGSLSQQVSGLENEKKNADAEISKLVQELTQVMSTLTIFETDSEFKTVELNSLVDQRDAQINQMENALKEKNLLLEAKETEILRLSEEILQLKQISVKEEAKKNEKENGKKIQNDEERNEKGENENENKIENGEENLPLRPETAEVSIQCERDQDTFTKKLAKKEKQLNDRFKTENEFRDQDCARLMAAKDKEIRRLKNLAETNGELLKLVANLRQQLELRGFSGDYESVLSKGVSEQSKPNQTPLTKMFQSRGRILSTSQNSNLNSLENEPEIELESTGILMSISRRSSISSRTGSFKYKDITPKRLAELQRRNSAQLPHMKSSYPVEQSDRTWRHDTPEQNSTDVAGSSCVETENSAEEKPEKKDGFLKKLSSSLHKGRKNSKIPKNKENIAGKNKMTGVTEKSVAFVVEITPPEKKKVPKPKR